MTDNDIPLGRETVRLLRAALREEILSLTLEEFLTLKDKFAEEDASLLDTVTQDQATATT